MTQTPGTFTIFTGDDKTMYLKAVNGGCVSDPLDLTSCTEISIALPLAIGGFTHLTLTGGKVAIISPALLGKFSCHIESSVSISLNPGEFQNVDVTFTISSRTFTVRFFQALSVFQRD